MHFCIDLKPYTVSNVCVFKPTSLVVHCLFIFVMWYCSISEPTSVPSSLHYTLMLSFQYTLGSEKCPYPLPMGGFFGLHPQPSGYSRCILCLRFVIYGPIHHIPVPVSDTCTIVKPEEGLNNKSQVCYWNL